MVLFTSSSFKFVNEKVTPLFHPFGNSSKEWKSENISLFYELEKLIPVFHPFGNRSSSTHFELDLNCSDFIEE